MSFDQRPARATKRVVAPLPAQSDAVQAPAPASGPSEKPSSNTALFVIGALLGGLLTTAGIYGFLPGLDPITLPKVLP
jgi:hypothetical protein